jgi:hypothetical protein
MRDASAPGGWRRLRAWLGSGALLPAPLQPALAAAALLMVVPAWMGLVQAPRDREESERLVRTVQEERARAESRASELESRANELASRASTAPRGGGVAALVLRGATRASEPTPALRLRAGQGLQPLLLDATPPAGDVSVRLLRQPSEVVWSAAGPREDFWDESNQLVGVLVPADVLSPGSYRIELASADGVKPYFSSSFTVSASTDSP